jgi:hypothetical protein
MTLWTATRQCPKLQTSGTSLAPRFPTDKVSGVDDNLLRSWLGLPPGSWPPDHYTLLGLSTNCDPAAVEPRVMQKMDRLRHHQLLHPDLVTEGMNRLAQALITLTDPAGKLAYDIEFGLKPSVASTPQVAIQPARPKAAQLGPNQLPVVVAEPVLDDELLNDDAAVGNGSNTMDLTQEIVLPAGGLGSLYEVLEEVEPPVSHPPVPLEIEPEEVVEAIAIVPPPVRPWPTPPSSRRWIYARLALLRKALRRWNDLRHVLGDPHDPIDRPGRMLLLLEAVARLRPHLATLTAVVGIGRPGGLVTTIVNQALLLDTIRRLLPDQRQALAIDWRRGQLELQHEYHRLRALAHEMRSRAEGIQRIPAVVRWLRDFPEIALVALALFALFLALVRSIIVR